MSLLHFKVLLGGEAGKSHSRYEKVSLFGSIMHLQIKTKPFRHLCNFLRETLNIL